MGMYRFGSLIVFVTTVLCFSISYEDIPDSNPFKALINSSKRKKEESGNPVFLLKESRESKSIETPLASQVDKTKTQKMPLNMADKTEDPICPEEIGDEIQSNPPIPSLDLIKSEIQKEEAEFSSESENEDYYNSPETFEEESDSFSEDTIFFDATKDFEKDSSSDNFMEADLSKKEQNQSENAIRRDNNLKPEHDESETAGGLMIEEITDSDLTSLSADIEGPEVISVEESEKTVPFTEKVSKDISSETNVFGKVQPEVPEEKDKIESVELRSEDNPKLGIQEDGDMNEGERQEDGNSNEGERKEDGNSNEGERQEDGNSNEDERKDSFLTRCLKWIYRVLSFFNPARFFLN